MDWLSLVLIAVAIFAATNIIDKIALTHWVKNSTILAILTGLVELPIAMVMLPFTGSLLMEYWQFLWAMSIGAIWVIAAVLYFRAIKMEEASRVVPLIFTKPIFVLIIATLLLGEVFTPIRYLGIALIVLGALSISLKKEEGITTKSKALVPITGAVIIWACMDIVSKTLFNITDLSAWQVIPPMMIGTFLGGFVLLTRKNLRSELFSFIPTKQGAILWINYSLITLAFFAYVNAVPIGPITLIASVNSAQALFVLFFAILASLLVPKLFKEELKGSIIGLKLVSIALIILGVYLVS